MSSVIWPFGRIDDNMDTAKILIVDDQIHALHGVSRIMRGVGYETFEASSGIACLKLAAEHRPDLILLDVVLPDIDGREVCRRIKTDPETKDSYVVLFSSIHVESDSQAGGLEQGADGYIVRPIPNRELLARVKSILRLKFAETRLRESEQRFHKMFEKHNAVMLLVEPVTGRIMDANNAAERFYGYTLSQLRSMFIQNIYALSQEEAEDESNFHLPEPRDFSVFQHRLADGEVRTVEVHSSIIEQDGQPQLFSIIHDITERKRLEEALKQNEEDKFRTVADFTYDWEYWINPIGNLLYISPSCERITGYSSDEFINNPSLLTDVIHPEDKSLVGDHFGTVDSGLAHEIDFRIITRTGETRWIGHSCQPVYREDGSWFGRRVSNRDITERKRIEEILKQKTKELERSNKDLEQFAYVAAHDLREPLVAVASYLKVLERLSKNPIESKIRKCIAKSMNLVLRMDDMLQGLLSYARMTLTPQSYENTNCNIALTDALSNLGFAIQKSGAAITSDTLPTLGINASQLVLIFQNLVANAIKYRGSEPMKIHVGCVAQESEYQFSVSDNGIGIDPPYLDRIFNMFERLEDLSGPSGTGIGLSTCRKLVERYGGRMWVDSKVGKGSTFYFSVPKE